jgi:hypothetical protein
MGYDISLVAVSIIYHNGEPVPFVVEEIGGLGFGTLAHTLEGEVAVGAYLVDPDDYFHSSATVPEIPGFTRYLVRSPKDLAEYIAADVGGLYWDGLNNPEEVVAALREHPEYTWWFHLDH